MFPHLLQIADISHRRPAATAADNLFCAEQVVYLLGDNTVALAS